MEFPRFSQRAMAEQNSFATPVDETMLHYDPNMLTVNGKSIDKKISKQGAEHEKG